MDDRDIATLSAEHDLRLPSKPVMGAVLILRGKQPVNEIVRWAGKTLRLGRVEGNDLRSAGDHASSREHATARYLRDGAWEFDILGSKAPTHINGAQMAPGKIQVPGSGSWIVLRFGGSIALFGDLQWYSVAPFQVGEIVSSPRLTQAYGFIEGAASTGRTTLIYGETGSGKEHAARHYRRSSPHAGGPYVELNCATLKGDTTITELFGATKGAFSGADRDRKGVFERADRGVLFLDEIGELALQIQPEMLRAVQEKVVIPLGGEKPRKVNTHLVCATHRNLDAEVTAGRFRQDLLQRLKGAVIELPPLRERLEEIPWLIARRSEELNVSSEFVEACLLHRWDGNVRELLEATGRAVIHARATEARTLFVADFDAAMRGPGGKVEAEAVAKEEPEVAKPKVRVPRDPAKQALFFAEYDAHGDIKRAAKAVGIALSTAYEWVEARGTRRE